MTKEQAFIKLYELINFYYENRDRPVDQGYDFYTDFNTCCETLGLDNQAIIEEFKLNTL